MKRIKIHILGRIARNYLRISMLLTVIYSLFLLFCYMDARKIDPVGATLYFSPLLEYVVASVCIALGGTMLLELVVNDPRFASKK